MTAHPQFEEDLALYALDALQGEERTALENHIQTCDSCRGELDQLRGDAAVLALSVSGAQPPARARQRLLAAASRESRRSSAPARTSWLKPLRIFSVAALVLLTIFLLRQNAELFQQLSLVQIEFSDQKTQLARARSVVAALTATDAMHVTLVAAKHPPQPQGKAIYSRDRGSLIFMANNMPMPPANKAYELWLIPMNGSPMPAGMFTPDARGNAVVVNPPLPPGIEAKTFAITVEPETGSPAPTSQPVMAGAGE
ncbi:MAG: anti-sigma factor [Acidobacteriales bacterium]|nr:anti-sigma factor [Terriglobales bacterium]